MSNEALYRCGQASYGLLKTAFAIEMLLCVDEQKSPSWGSIVDLSSHKMTNTSTINTKSLVDWSGMCFRRLDHEDNHRDLGDLLGDALFIIA